MRNRFLEYYSEELEALRGRAGRFADAFPKIAGRLRLSPETSDDPHVERLVQSFAYSTARLRQKLDDSLPELSDGLLETLYPHYLAPVPAMTVLAIAPDPEADAQQILPRGTQIDSERVEGDICRFSTTQDVALAPIRIESVRMMNRPIEAPALPGASPAGCLRITLVPMGKTPISELGLTRFRFFAAGSARQAQTLHAHLMQHVTRVAVAAHGSDSSARFLPSSALKPVGFTVDEALLPSPEGAFPGYRLLTEFFALPEKFLFFDIETGPISQTDRLDLYLYLDKAPDSLEQQVSRQSLLLGATPVVNLFETRAEPVVLDGTRASFPLLADARRADTRQVHSITRITLSDAAGQTMPAWPFFHRISDRAREGVFYQIDRSTRTSNAAARRASIAFVDSRGEATAPGELTAGIDILATNGALPRALPFGGGQPRLRFASPVEGAGAITCLRPISLPDRTDHSGDHRWQLMSHLSLNHLSLETEGAAALKGILRLYDPGDSRETAQMIDAIHEARSKPAIARLSGVVVSGVDITLTLDPDQIEPGRAMLFSSVIDHFLGAYTTLNTFTRMRVRLKDRADTLAQFAARSGEQPLI
ncbi:type VI secretion system baseplate subunit TssF [Ruegeria jejuensis]|uniref:type VI secretion system baseplate subunit TssF n=1 Tax=Ruegeria jejuensis TaxID=3233338 RepID=UPI00355B14AF